MNIKIYANMFVTDLYFFYLNFIDSPNSFRSTEYKDSFEFINTNYYSLSFTSITPEAINFYFYNV